MVTLDSCVRRVSEPSTMGNWTPRLKTMNKSFGCRSPISSGIGAWDGAFVIFVKQDDPATVVMFESNRDFVGQVEFAVAMQTYQKLIQDDWVPMSADDIGKTSGTRPSRWFCLT